MNYNFLYAFNNNNNGLLICREFLFTIRNCSREKTEPQ